MLQDHSSIVELIDPLLHDHGTPGCGAARVGVAEPYLVGGCVRERRKGPLDVDLQVCGRERIVEGNSISPCPPATPSSFLFLVLLS